MKFSIVTPSFNQAPFIEETLASVHSQVFGRCDEVKKEDYSVEHLVFDGGSADGTRGLLEEWKRRWAHGMPGSACYSFSYVSAVDDGQTAAINRGLREASGDILAYLCSDDLYEPGALAAVAAVFSKHPDVDVVYGDFYFLEGDSGWKRLKKAGRFSRRRLLETNFLGQPSVFWRRKVYEKHGSLDEALSFCMDYEYWLRISEGCRFFYVERPLSAMRLHGGGKTGSQFREMWRETESMLASSGCPARALRNARWQQGAGCFYYLFKRLLFKALGKWIVHRRKA